MTCRDSYCHPPLLTLRLVTVATVAKRLEVFGDIATARPPRHNVINIGRSYHALWMKSIGIAAYWVGSKKLRSRTTPLRTIAAARRRWSRLALRMHCTPRSARRCEFPTAWLAAHPPRSLRHHPPSRRALRTKPAPAPKHQEPRTSRPHLEVNGSARPECECKATSPRDANCADRHSILMFQILSQATPFETLSQKELLIASPRPSPILKLRQQPIGKRDHGFHYNACAGELRMNLSHLVDTRHTVC